MTVLRTLAFLLNVECNCLACLLWRLPLMVHICEARDMNADYIRKYAVINYLGYFTAFLSVIRLILGQYLAAEERFLPYPLQIIINNYSELVLPECILFSGINRC
jgi:hypothetical protein